MIANAQKDEDGKYTDLGHLTLTTGELFVKHIYPLSFKNSSSKITATSGSHVLMYTSNPRYLISELNFQNPSGMHDGDNGYTLRASVNLAKSDKSVGMNKYGVVFAGRSGDGYTFGTIGKGDFKCTEDGRTWTSTKLRAFSRHL